ncbi:MAG: hypothetical protein GQ531_03605 [Sulfurovum sp.]|nr:hypothetical protein [Sulfurovum sp.]
MSLLPEHSAFFNKKYKRAGHLWQGRFKSWYVTDEVYIVPLAVVYGLVGAKKKPGGILKSDTHILHDERLN